MKLVRNVLAFLLVVAILAGLGWGGYIGLKFLVNQYEIVDRDIAAILVISSVIVLVSTLIIAGAIRNLDKGSDKQIHPEKAVLYTRFMESWYNENEEEGLRQLLDLEQSMLLWAGDQVLKEYLKLHELIRDESSKDNLINQAQQILNEIRRDLGAQNKDINESYIKNLLSLKSSG